MEVITSEHANSCFDCFFGKDLIVVQENHDPNGYSTFSSFSLRRQEDFSIEFFSLSAVDIFGVIGAQFHDGFIVCTLGNGIIM